MRIFQGTPKLVGIEPGSDSVTKVIPLPGTVALQSTHLDDIRFSPDGRTGYVTGGGTRGAIIVIDLEAGEGVRALDGHPSTQGRQVRHRLGRRPTVAPDGISIPNDGSTLCWQALTGRTLYAIDTTPPRPQVAEAGRASAVQTDATTHVADGLWMSGAGTLHLTSSTGDSIKR